MSKPFDRLQSVLKLEAQQGYKNKAVVGGIRQFVSFWVEQARAVAIDEADNAFIEQTADALTEYGQMSGNSRKMLVDRLIDKLGERKLRVVDDAAKSSSQSPAQSSPPAASPPQTELSQHLDFVEASINEEIVWPRPVLELAFLPQVL